jgi:superfamily II DNA helicase RecQ
LSEIIKKEIKTLEALKQINGFGNRKVEKYGKDIIGIINVFYGIQHEG